MCNKKNLKEFLMGTVIVGGFICMILSFTDVNNRYILAALSALTVIVPAFIWFDDSKENDRQNQRLDQHEDSITWG